MNEESINLNPFLPKILLTPAIVRSRNLNSCTTPKVKYAVLFFLNSNEKSSVTMALFVPQSGYVDVLKKITSSPPTFVN